MAACTFGAQSRSHLHGYFWTRPWNLLACSVLALRVARHGLIVHLLLTFSPILTQGLVSNFMALHHSFMLTIRDDRAYSYAIRGRAGTEVFGPDSSTRSSKHNFPTSRSSTGTKLYTQHHPEAFGDLHKVSSSATKIYANIVAHRPPNFGDLDYAEKEIAMFVKDRATSAKAYEVATYLDNRDAYTANGRLTNHYESFSHVPETRGPTALSHCVPGLSGSLRIGSEWAFRILVRFILLSQRSHPMRENALNTPKGINYKTLQRSILTLIPMVGYLREETLPKSNYRTRHF